MSEKNLDALAPSSSRRPRRGTAIVLLMILAAMVTAMGLRPGATSVGPVLPEVIESLGMSGALAGLLTALPGLCFAFFGLMSNRFASLTGFVGALVIASALSTLGLALRALTGSWELFLLLSMIGLSGMAVGNVILPAFIKKEFHRRSAQMATAYTTFLAVGATLPTFLTPILARKGELLTGVGQGWRLALGTWALISLVALVLWVLLYWRDGALRERERPLRTLVAASLADQAAPLIPPQPKKQVKIWHSKTAIALMFFFGLQSMQAYTQFGWAPAAYRAGGLDSSSAGLMLAMILLGGIPGGLLVPSLVARGRALQWWIVFFGLMLVIGYLGIAFLPTTVPWLWAAALSVSGFCFPMALALIIDKTDDPTITAALSGFVQPVGYLLAALGPFLVGLVFGLIGNWVPILLALTLTSVPMVAAGIIAARGRTVDADLAAHR